MYVCPELPLWLPWWMNKRGRSILERLPLAEICLKNEKGLNNIVQVHCVNNFANASYKIYSTYVHVNGKQ